MGKLAPLTRGTLTIKSVRVDRSHVNACLDAMDLHQDDAGEVRRRACRFLYRIPNAIVQPDREDKNVAFIVSTRNISVGGMSILHSQMMYPGSACKVELATRHGGWLTIKATVAHCHLVRGMLHEVGLKFDKPIDLGQLSYAPDTGDRSTN